MKKFSAEKIYDAITFSKIGCATNYSLESRQYMQGERFNEQAFLQVKEKDGAGSLVNLLQKRTSCRRFVAGEMEPGDFLSVLMCAYSLKNKQGSFTVPLAGGLAVMHISLLVRKGETWQVHVWDPVSYKLQRAQDLKTKVRNIFFNKTTDIEAASGIIIISAHLHGLAKQYGARAYKFACIQAGHIAQNILLAAQECGQGSLTLGALKENEMVEALGLCGPKPIYAVVLGGSKGGGNEQ